MTRIYTHIRWLSLDVSVGAIVLLAFLCQEFNLDFRWNEAAALGLTVWLIYTVDHLLDIQKSSNIVSKRRLYHQALRRPLWLGALFATISLIWVCSTLSGELILAGAVVGLVCMTYLWILTFYKLVWKELLVATVYAVGVGLAPAVQMETITPTFYLAIGLLALVALTNVLVFASMEQQQDEAEGHSSLRLIKGEKWLKVLVYGGCVLGMLGVVWLLETGELKLASFFGLVLFLNGLMLFKADWFIQKERYRIFGDTVLCLPIFWLF